MDRLPSTPHVVPVPEEAPIAVMSQVENIESLLSGIKNATEITADLIISNRYKEPVRGEVVHEGPTDYSLQSRLAAIAEDMDKLLKRVVNINNAIGGSIL